MKPLTENQIEQFIREGYVRLNNAFSQSTAAECRNLLWKACGYDPDNAATWLQPVVRLGEMFQPPFIEAANTPALHGAFDQLVGPANWLPRKSLGSFPLRFPHHNRPGDDGWHVDASFPGDDPGNYFNWRVNVFSEGRGLLMLFLFSEVGSNDAPTRIRAGSHVEMARLLAPEGRKGLSFMELAQKAGTTEGLPEIMATGEPGTVYLCHPFMVHAAQAHNGTNPKLMAQPPLQIKEALQLQRSDNDYSPVEQAIRLAIS